MMGDIVVNLGRDAAKRKAVTLKCTLGAAMAVDQNLGGLVAALRQVAAGNLTSIADIIAAGSGMKPETAREEVFATGVASLIDPVTDFVVLLTMGGRKDEPKPAKKDDGEGES